MPTKKRRVGFIPRNDVLDIIKDLSYENNLSYSKIINILVEEALSKRGLFNIIKGSDFKKNNIKSKEDDLNFKESNVFHELNDTYNGQSTKMKNINFKEVREEPLDNEIYNKFLMFLQFQERMKNREIK